MRKIDMFIIDGKYCGRTHSYDYADDAKYDKKVLEDLLNGLSESKILCYTGLDVLDYNDESFIGNDSILWLYEIKYKETDTKNDIRECILRCSTEDIEWTKWRNEGLTGIFYRKITFLPEVQELLRQKYQEYIDLLTTIINEIEAEEMEKSKAREERFNQWKLTKTYKKVMPSGGEDGIDGYIDAEYVNANGEMIRMVHRDVFDFGTYSYPKRLEGTDNALKYDAKTEDEKSLSKWLAEFGDFHGIRM